MNGPHGSITDTHTHLLPERLAQKIRSFFDQHLPGQLAYDAINADDRPFDFTPIETVDLPATPTRDRNIAASAWVEAPRELLVLGEPLGIAAEATAFKRRIGEWLLWRAGPARGPAKYLAINSGDLAKMHTFHLEADGAHHGVGPSGVTHDRFRSFKEDLLGRT